MGDEEGRVRPAPGGREADLPAGRVEADGSAVVRVLSYNVRSLRDDRAALSRVIRGCDPDVVCLQEAPRFFRWRQHTRDLASDCGLLWVAGGRPASGPAVLTSLRPWVERTEDVLLPRTPGLHQRGFAVAVLRIAAVRFTVLSCHLSLATAERYTQAGKLRETLESAGGRYAVAAGDVNETPRGRSWRRLTEDRDDSVGLRDAHAVAPWSTSYTSEARTPRQRIDGIFTSPHVEVLGCGVPETLPGVREADMAAATDHLPVLAALRFPAEDPGEPGEPST